MKKHLQGNIPKNTTRASFYSRKGPKLYYIFFSFEKAAGVGQKFIVPPLHEMLLNMD